MHVLSIEDIDFLVTTANSKKINVETREQRLQIDQLIRMGYVRPFSGTFVLTDLGEKTAQALQIKLYIPEEPMAIGSDVRADDEHADMPAVEHAETEAVTETEANAAEAAQ